VDSATQQYQSPPWTYTEYLFPASGIWVATPDGEGARDQVLSWSAG